MFCPVCQAEYRDGFYRCADCDVELVHELPAHALIPSRPLEDPSISDEDPFCSFWQGDDPRIHAEICELLSNEKIPHRTIRRADHLFHIFSYPAFQVGIPFSMFDRAETIIKEAYGSEEAADPASRILPADASQIPGTRFDPEGLAPSSRRIALQSQGDFPAPANELSDSASESAGHRGIRTSSARRAADLDEAQTEIWSGDDPDTAEFIGAALQTNEILCRRDARAGKHLVYVFPEDEPPAREIVREVVEGVPPE
ncbi:MAG TPA: hypothetical protein VJN93_09575 [Candidatus Acidoferrum sp.]|nr:hypothetical protein [Candidatus Acidoferrum sp.]